MHVLRISRKRDQRKSWRPDDWMRTFLGPESARLFNVIEIAETVHGGALLYPEVSVLPKYVMKRESDWSTSCVSQLCIAMERECAVLVLSLGLGRQG